LWFLKYHKPAEHPTLSAAELAYINQDRSRRSPPSTPWIKLLGYPPDLGVCHSQVPHRSHLVVLSLLAAGLLQRQIPSELVGLGLPILIVYNASTIGSIYGGYLPASFIRMGLTAQRARLAAMLLCACLVVPVFHQSTTPFRNGSQSDCSAWLRPRTRAGRATSSPRPRICSRAAQVGSVTGIGTMAGAIGGFLFCN
jgi:MFS transporter, ACS family, hexuronate transporter